MAHPADVVAELFERPEWHQLLSTDEFEDILGEELETFIEEFVEEWTSNSDYGVSRPTRLLPAFPPRKPDDSR